MGLYRRAILPRLCDVAMRNRRLGPYRERVVRGATGRVLEIGAGSGLNLRLYGPAAREVFELEPDPKLIAMAKERALKTGSHAHFLEASAEHIPLEDHSIDSIVTTWTLCSIPDAAKALEEMRRVLKPAGRLLFVEHGSAPERNVRKWQDRLTPVWRHLSGGCHLNRPIDHLIRAAGFAIDTLETGYLAGPKILTYFYEGGAHPR